MKNGLLIWNILLTLAIGFLLVMYFGKNGNKNTVKNNHDGDTSAVNKDFRIAYFEMDSVSVHFDLVKEVKAELNKKENEINNEMDRLGKNFQERFTHYQNLAISGGMSAEDQEKASDEMRKLEDQMKSRKSQLDQDYTDLVTRRQNEIKSMIEGFLKEYNKTKNYSYIISYEQGLFYYKDSVYNITDDLVKGLNERYKKSKK
ncbi:MAG TPA: OmpH family outer membrane protein [Chitinophagaceae bacterium]|nr:OmpH family outer membrane protein [Chitinophagaceae bacterium]MCB9056493.1 OmpH family outer membrane protein [Chitinophagales bacterium]HPG11628.1 OmpH family outer membrane protein [Chitinophagaceae bacterium]HRX94098.1 OmpH family outer membrane protein [Chitinophagaceae bacterium]